ncbi:hypothetical protein Q0590_08665 [Rhodocytophaga aerolata]|uniref:Uncharacterized protein n=1 Tax=Rhodocytophaga aerolata TaxID=455078 RepID=A0ABT8R6L0_9BACT|nr:hypothetical protein [Rhodocytophaga aerolata]MDO1446320.1 hypothetical protein [Rhodocytophaga aerolata]
MINYQGVARNTQGSPISNKVVYLYISILKDSPTGIVEYKEKHQVTTNSMGLFSLGIGAGTVQTGQFSSITWATGKKFAKVELSTDNINFLLMGTQQLLSVPYALYSGLPWATNGSNVYYNRGNIAIGTTSPLNATLQVNSTNTASSYAQLRITGYKPRIDLDYAGKTRWRLASLDNTHFAIENQTLNTQPFFLTTDGKVGLGTSQPVTKLHLNNGNILLTGGQDKYIFFGDTFPISGQTEAEKQAKGLMGRFIKNTIGSDELLFNGAHLTFHTYEAFPGFEGYIRYFYNTTNNISINMRSTRIGLGSTDPKAAIHIASGDVYLEDATKGVIMKSPDGSCWKMTVSNGGTPVFSKIVCP